MDVAVRPDLGLERSLIRLFAAARQIPPTTLATRVS